MSPTIKIMLSFILLSMAGLAPSADAEQALRIRDAVKAIPGGAVLAVQENGIPRVVKGGIPGITAITEAGLAKALPRVAKAFDLAPGDLKWHDVRKDKDGSSRVRYQQWHRGLEVIGSSLTVLVRKNGEIQRTVAETATALPDTQIAFPAVLAQARALKDYEPQPFDVVIDGGRLVYVISTKDQSTHLAWVFEAKGVREGEYENDRVFISAKTGEFIDRHPQFIKALNRQISAGGIFRRGEGGPASTDAFVNTNYNHLGTAYAFFLSVFGRDSYNNAGGALISNVRDVTYQNGQNVSFNNAWWSLSAHNFHFGMTDGVTFSNMVNALDVTAHEFGHGVTQYESNLTYSNESGAINECMSDVFGAGCEKRRDGTVTANAWKIGEEIYTPSTSGDGLRYMNNPTLDGQSVDFWPERKYIGTPTDNGGVHLNSGIGNLAFVLMANGGTHPRGKTTVSVPAIGFDVALQIFYHANCNYLGASSNFAALRSATASSANDLYGAVVADRVHTAWDAVGVPGSVPKPVVTITASDSSATEGGDSGAYRILVNQARPTDLVVRFRLPTGGTATSGSDYYALPTSVTIPANTPANTPFVIPVTPINDPAYESTETVILALESNTPYVIGTPGSATVSIIDNDKATVTITASDASATEGGDTAAFTISRGIAVNTPVTISLWSPSGTASNLDNTGFPSSGLITIPANAATTVVTLVSTNDTTAEPPETVVWTLSPNPSYVIGSPASATVTIHDNDIPAVFISSPDFRGKEGGSDNGRFTIGRFGSLTAPLTVNLGRTGTATAGSDYTAIPASVTIPAHANSLDVAVSVLDDTIAEAGETVVVTILPGTGYTVGSQFLFTQATVDISDNETPRLTIADGAAEEGFSGTFTITRIGDLAIPLTANLGFTGTAIYGTDYDAIASTLSLGAYVVTQTITVRTIDDTIEEPQETVICTIASGTGYVVGAPAAATFYIRANDVPPSNNGFDIGTVGFPGSSEYWIETDRGGDSSVDHMRVSGSGADIGNQADGFHFRIQGGYTGDGEFVARVKSLGNTHPWAKAGVMFRADMSPGSVNGMMAITPANGAVFQHRATNGGSTASATVSGRTAPYWVKIKRSGTNVSGWMSADGVAWTQVGTTVVLPLGATPLVGFAVTSHDNTKVTDAVFSEFLWIPAGGG